jgi:hypothetical protein
LKRSIKDFKRILKSPHLFQCSPPLDEAIQIMGIECMGAFEKNKGFFKIIGLRTNHSAAKKRTPVTFIELQGFAIKRQSAVKLPLFVTLLATFKELFGANGMGLREK